MQVEKERTAKESWTAQDWSELTCRIQSAHFEWQHAEATNQHMANPNLGRSRVEYWTEQGKMSRCEEEGEVVIVGTSAGGNRSESEKVPAMTIDMIWNAPKTEPTPSLFLF